MCRVFIVDKKSLYQFQYTKKTCVRVWKKVQVGRTAVRKTLGIMEA